MQSEIEADDEADDAAEDAADDSAVEIVDLNLTTDAPSAREQLAHLTHLARRVLPGDSEYGDSLSTAGDQTPQMLARRISEAGNQRPSALRELGLGALQLYRALSDAHGSASGEIDVAILFTDLVGFSKWSLKAGDEAALALLRAIDEAQTPVVRRAGGEIVKRLGDGAMAAFSDPVAATRAAIGSVAAIAAIDQDGYRPALRAGVHLGRPRRVGADYIGVDVNIAARVAEAAKGGEVLVSDATREASLDDAALRFRRKLIFRGKGTPTGMAVYAARLAKRPD